MVNIGGWPQALRFAAPDGLRRTANTRRLSIEKFIAAAAFAISLIFAGVLIVLELNKATLSIESEADDVPIRIVQREKTVKRLTVTKSPQNVRIAAGNYIVEIDGDFQGVTVHNSELSLKRGGKEIVRVVRSDKLTHVEGVSIAEAAAQLGVNIGNVYIARSRVMGRMREFAREFEVAE